MSVAHKVVSVTTTAQTLLALTALNGALAQEIWLQATSASATPIMVGGSLSTLTTTNYGAVIPTPVTNVPAAPLVIDVPTSLADWQVIAAATTGALSVTVIY